MTLTIVDASVAMKWYIENEPRKEAALSLLSEIEEDPKRFGVPELFFNEMLAVFCRLSLPERDIKRYIGVLQELGLYRLGNGKELLDTAAEISSRYKISGYDAIYAASAKLTSGRWITTDRVAHRKIHSLGISSAI